MTSRNTVLAALALTATLTLTACGGPDEPTRATGAKASATPAVTTIPSAKPTSAGADSSAAAGAWLRQSFGLAAGEPFQNAAGGTWVRHVIGVNVDGDVLRITLASRDEDLAQRAANGAATLYRLGDHSGFELSRVEVVDGLGTPLAQAKTMRS